MATLAEIRTAIQRVIVDPQFYTDDVVDEMINDSLQKIAGGVEMPDRELSPPLPGLYKSDIVQTSTSLPYVSLPADYQRNVFYVSDNVDYRIHPVRGGDYYSFTLFMNSAVKKDLSLPGTVMSVCVKGDNLYYQGIPASSQNIRLQYYRKPAALTIDSDVPEGIPSHLAKDIIKHHVCMEIFGEGIEDGSTSEGRGYSYHEQKFYKAMATMIKFLGIDAEPEYYAAGGSGYNPGDDW